MFAVLIKKYKENNVKHANCKVYYDKEVKAKSLFYEKSAIYNKLRKVY